MKAKLDHIALVVESLDVACFWFKEYFDFNKILVKAPMKANGGSGTRCLVANENLDVLEFLEYDDALKLETGIIQHIGFTVDDVEDFFTSLSSGMRLHHGETIKDMGKAKILYFKGIDGIEFELIEKVEE